MKYHFDECSFRGNEPNYKTVLVQFQENTTLGELILWSIYAGFSGVSAMLAAAYALGSNVMLTQVVRGLFIVYAGSMSNYAVWESIIIFMSWAMFSAFGFALISRRFEGVPNRLIDIVSGITWGTLNFIVIYSVLLIQLVEEMNLKCICLELLIPYSLFGLILGFALKMSRKSAVIVIDSQQKLNA